MFKMLHNIKCPQALMAHERHRVIKKGLTVTLEEIACFIDHAMTEQERKKTLMFKPAKRIALDGKGY